MIEAHQLTKRYPGGHLGLEAVTLSIAKGELVTLTGPSGAGKSTFLKLLAAIERPTAGSLVVEGQNLGRLPRRAVPYWRRRVGMVFQDLRLLYDRNCFENVMLPLRIAGIAPREAARRAHVALERVGLAAKARAMPITLSGGEQQRLAIARAIVHRPRLLLADEPTAHVDDAHAQALVDLLGEFNRAGVTVIVATHAPRLLARLNPRTIVLDAGRSLP